MQIHRIKSWKWQISMSLVAIALCGGYAIHKVREHRSTDTAGPDQGMVDIRMSEASGRFVRAWTKGRDHAYDLDLSSVATAKSQPLVHVSVRGPMHIVPLQTEPTVLLAARFDGTISFAGPGAGGDPANASLEHYKDELREPVFFEYSKDGDLSGVRVAANTSDIVSRIWRSFGSTLQLKDGDQGARAWETDESDSSGRYQAHYAVDDAGTITRRKTRYTAPAPGSKTTITVVESHTTFSLATTGILDRVTVLDHLNASGSGIFDFDATTTIDLRASGLSAASDTATLASAATAATPLSFNGRIGARSKDLLDNARIGGRTFASVMAELMDEEPRERDRTATDAEKQKAGKSYIALAAMLRQKPETLPNVREHIMNQGPLTDTLIAALRDASTPAAQALLRETIAADALASRTRFEAVRALSLVTQPTRESADALKQLEGKGDLSAIQAAYGLGSMARNADGTDPGLSDDLVGHLLQALRTATSDETRVLYLTALGNAGDPTTVEAIAPYATWPAKEVRAASAQALRRIASERSDALLVGLCADSEESVRESAVVAIDEHAPSLVLISVISQLALQDHSAAVRSRALTVAIEWMGAQTSLRGVVQTVASNDSNDSIRKKAAAALDRKHG